MRKTILAIALAAPLAAPAAPPPGMGPGRGGPGMDSEARRAYLAKRMRMVRAIGLAEALDLSEAEALRAREVMEKFDERRMAIGRQMREAVETLRQAARGEAGALKGVDEALKRVRDLRAQAQALSDEMFRVLTKEFTPERKAKAALFFRHLRGRMGRHHLMDERHGGGMGPGGMGPGGMGPGGMGRGMGPMGGGPRWGMGDGPDPDEVDVEILPEDEPI